MGLQSAVIRNMESKVNSVQENEDFSDETKAYRLRRILNQYISLLNDTQTSLKRDEGNLAIADKVPINRIIVEERVAELKKDIQVYIYCIACLKLKLNDSLSKEEKEILAKPPVFEEPKVEEPVKEEPKPKVEYIPPPKEEPKPKVEEPKPKTKKEIYEEEYEKLTHMKPRKSDGMPTEKFKIWLTEKLKQEG